MNNIIFKHIPRTAGNSLKEILPEKVLFLGHDYYNPNYKHLLFHLINIKHKFVFAFIRNPYDRVVSAFHYLNAGGNNPFDVADRDKYIKQYDGNFDNFVKNAFPGITYQIHFMPQYTWIYLYKQCLCDYVGKLETIENDLRNIGNIINYDFPELPCRNGSRRGHYENYYTEETKEIIYKYYEKDFRLFGYGK